MDDKILFITALKSELNSIEQNIKKQNNYFFRICECGLFYSLFNLNNLINEIKPSIIINSGICGSLIEKLIIGDIIFPTNVYLFENGYYYGNNQFNYFDIVKYPHLKCNSEIIIKTANVNFNYKIGNVVSGNSAVFSKQKRIELNKNFDAIAVDMELFSIAFLCHKYKIKLFSIKVVSDTIEDNIIEKKDNIKELVSKENFNKALLSLGNFFKDRFSDFFVLLKEGEL